jgi:hypothetical protein
VDDRRREPVSVTSMKGAADQPIFRFPIQDEAPMQDRSKEFDQLIEHLRHALILAGNLEQVGLAFLIDRAIAEAHAQAMPTLKPGRLQ